ncbi:hypothetical protein JTB14_028966 [Gonioctena quinquepunctata]|nr:hypothetical protein JTB14_028966 [Gonioctena quinquepunctata]
MQKGPEVGQSQSSKNALEKPEQQRTREKTMPRIIIEGTNLFGPELRRKLKKDLGRDVLISFSRYRTTLNTFTEKDHYKMIEILCELKAEFKTFTMDEEKTQSFVLRGLENRLTEEEVKEELESQGLEIRNVVDAFGFISSTYYTEGTTLGLYPASSPSRPIQNLTAK